MKLENDGLGAVASGLVFVVVFAEFVFTARTQVHGKFFERRSPLELEAFFLRTCVRAVPCPLTLITNF